MYFNSFEFIFLFLPITLVIYYLISQSKKYKLTIFWLIIASLFFYGWWNIKYLVLIIFSIGLNYSIGYFLRIKANKLKLIIGITANLFILGYFKYANFFIDNINYFSDSNFEIKKIILPLGISFFTFQQITYLVDTYLGKVREHDFIKYCLFVSFFPQLIAGPIVHHKQMMPQFENNLKKNLKLDNLSIGITTFIIGLFKKVVVADNLSFYSDPIFFASENGFSLTFFEAWGGAVAFMLQLYFDFSGYTDMALGIGIMFGIILPINFASPFKSKNISEFWRCWHITLSRLVRNYLYLPLSLQGTRLAIKKNFNSLNLFFIGVIFPTMFAFFWVGLWHGAGWNYICFGLLNGFYIVVFNLWISVKKNFSNYKTKNVFLSNFFSRIFTFSLVTLSFVLFRAKDISSAEEILKAMIGLNGIQIFDIFRIGEFATNPLFGVIFIIFLLVVVFYFPNTQSFIFNRNKSIFNRANRLFSTTSSNKFCWKPTLLWGAVFGLIFLISIMFISNTNEFLYFEF